MGATGRTRVEYREKRVRNRNLEDGGQWAVGAVVSEREVQGNVRATGSRLRDQRR